MLVLSQKSWSTISYDEVNAEICSLATTWRRRNPLGLAGPLVLLPLAEQIPLPPELPDLQSAIGAIAKKSACYVAGAARVQGEGRVGHHVVGFIFDADGNSLLVMPKISPSLIEGFVDGEICSLGTVARFPVARTPMGQIGLLTSEDLLFPHYARSLVWSGRDHSSPDYRSE